jgi:hypothetical protein
LGQPDSFKDFAAWLSASSTQFESDEILYEAENQGSLLASISYAHGQYISKYGSRRAFYRFVNDVLPPALSAELLFSVAIRRIDIAANREVDRIKAKDRKLKFLYEVRNSFTHDAVNTGSPAGRSPPKPE